MNIANTLLKFNEHKLPKNFVSVAVKIEKRKPTHAAILIRHLAIDYLHHFPGGTPPIVEENFNEDGWYIYNILSSFEKDDANEIGAFLQYCRRICSKSQITYSYTAFPSYYAENGDFVGELNLPELGTCVGFCIYTLSNAIIDSDPSNPFLLALDDWGATEIDPRIDNRSRQQVQTKYPSMDWTLYEQYKKRITPLEYLCSSFFTEYPIAKAAIDGIKQQVMDAIISKFDG